MVAKIFVLALILAGIYVFFKIKDKKQDEQKYTDNNEEVKAVEMKQDAVCGSYVEETTKYKVRLHDKIYYFCSEECKNKFIDENTNH